MGSNSTVQNYFIFFPSWGWDLKLLLNNFSGFSGSIWCGLNEVTLHPTPIEMDKPAAALPLHAAARAVNLLDVTE